MLKTKLISSLEKVFCDEKLSAVEFNSGSALRGETYAFQFAYFTEAVNQSVKIEVKSELKDFIKVRYVGHVPCEHPGSSFDDNVLRSRPGLFPDPLLPVDDLKTVYNQWRSLWVSVDIPEDCQAGKFDIEIKFNIMPHVNIPDQEIISQSEIFTLEVLPVTLPAQKLIHTEWFHTDCIATYYGEECWSERHWELLDKYIANAVDHGINMILTPLWTPPLDTAIGGERPTNQLLEIEKSGDSYSFCFSKLERWIDMCLKNGVEYFEMSHLFSQWGAKAAPKIVVKEDGENKKLFGWHVAADSPEYVNFLNQMLPELVGYLKNKGVAEKCYFHISDEPRTDNIKGYKQAKETVSAHLKDFIIIDALSEIEFYKHGIVEHPVPSNNHIEEFYKQNIENLWTYYCVSQWDKVPNRFFAFPSARNRIMGTLLFKYDLAGFLQWGFNFWYTQYSLNQHIDPFRVTDAGGAFGGGDAFMVYPGPDGPIDSLKYEVFREGLQDLRAMRLLEEKIGRKKTVEFIEEGLNYSLKMDKYPRSSEWILVLRDKINRRLAELM
jgi:hypothetical protein